MRGTIIMWNGDKGVVSAQGQRHDFDISHWKADTAPQANTIIEVEVANGALRSVTPVNEADLAREKITALTGRGSKVAKAVLENVGSDVAIAYGAFLFAALFLSVVSITGASVSITLADLLSGKMGMGAAFGGGDSGKGMILTLIAAATIAVPYLWRHKYALLAFCTPLLFTAKAFWPVYQQYSQAQKQLQAMGELGQMMSQMAGEMTRGISVGIGGWVVIAAGVYLTSRGVLRFTTRA